METHIGTRIKQFREFKNLRQNAFSETAGVRQQTLSTIEAGGSEPSFPILRKLFDAFPDLNPDWLLLGAGTMLRGGRALAPAPARTPEPAPDYTSAAGTIDATVNLLLKEQLSEARERATADRATIAWLQAELGKSPGSSDAAGPYAPTPPRPVAGFVLNVTQRVAGRGRAQESR